MSAPPPKIRREEAQFSVRHHDYVDEDRRSRRRNGREDEHHYRAREGTARVRRRSSREEGEIDYRASRSREDEDKTRRKRHHSSGPSIRESRRREDEKKIREEAKKRAEEEEAKAKKVREEAKKKAEEEEAKARKAAEKDEELRIRRLYIRENCKVQCLDKRFLTHLSSLHPTSALHELCTRLDWAPPNMGPAFECGPPMDRRYIFKAVVNGHTFMPAVAVDSKKDAKTNAAWVALQELGFVKKDPANPL